MPAASSSSWASKVRWPATAQAKYHVPAPQVRVVDTTAAGDAFTAALAVALVEGQSLAEATCFACAAGALATTRAALQDAMPAREDVERRSRDQFADHIPLGDDAVRPIEGVVQLAPRIDAEQAIDRGDEVAGRDGAVGREGADPVAGAEDETRPSRRRRRASPCSTSSSGRGRRRCR